MVGYFIEPFSHSFRKRLVEKARFYFFDIGLTRALARQLSLQPAPGTSYYGEIFEHFIVNECMKLAQLHCPEYRFSFLKTKDGAEIDLVVDRPGQPLLLIEIKSTSTVQEAQLTTLKQISSELKADAVVLSQDSITRKIEGIRLYPWYTGISKLFSIKKNKIKL
jgi:predicted AAA+ superfamily ATPase